MKDSDFQQLSITLTEHDKVWCYCPMHNDTIRPNLSISLLDKYYGRWKCWACGRNGCLSKEQMSELNPSSFTAHKNNKYNLFTMWKQFSESCCDNLQKFPLLKLGLAKELNVSMKSLDEWLVGYDGISFTTLMFREELPEYSRECGICGVQRRFPDGTKRCITGSRLGLMYPRNYIDGDYMFICEGFSDGISVWDLGLQSIARPHCRYIDGVRGFFKYILGSIETVIIVPDNDVVGIDGAKQLQYDVLSGLQCFDMDGFGMDLDISIFSFDGAKDIRDYIKLKGKEVVRKELLRLF